MPGFDGTGPMGMGPGTGRGLGPCNPYSNPNPNNQNVNPAYGPGYGPGFGRGFFGRGMGRGRGFGRGRGWSRTAYNWPAFGGLAYPYESEASPQQEMDVLKEEATFLKTQLEEIQSRIKTLEEEK